MLSPSELAHLERYLRSRGAPKRKAIDGALGKVRRAAEPVAALQALKLPYDVYADTLLLLYRAHPDELRFRAERGVKDALARHKARETRRLPRKYR